MNKQEKIHQLNVDLINLMMEKYSITYNDIISNLDENKQWLIDGKNWFQYYTFTQAEADEFRKKAVDLIKKSLRCAKSEAEREFSWWFLDIGLAISDDTQDKPYEIIGRLNKKR